MTLDKMLGCRGTSLPQYAVPESRPLTPWQLLQLCVRMLQGLFIFLCVLTLFHRCMHAERARRSRIYPNEESLPTRYGVAPTARYPCIGGRLGSCRPQKREYGTGTVCHRCSAAGPRRRETHDCLTQVGRSDRRSGRKQRAAII